MSTRTKRKRIDWEHRPRIRYYCPKCGHVRGPSKSAPNDMGHNGRNLVYPHTKFGGESCPGGPIDPVKDRAP